MTRIIHGFFVAASLVFSGAVWADTTSITHGGDTFVAGAQVNEAIASDGDTFVAARTIEARGNTAGDLHVSGFDVSISTDTAQDLYAAGANVLIRSNIAEDLTAAGFSLRTDMSSVTKGNARLFGNSVTIDGPIEGALMVTGRDVILNAPIGGDARIVARTLSFGPDAVVSGALTYSSKEEIAVPDRVAKATRVTFEAYSQTQFWDGWDEIQEEMPTLPSTSSILFSFVVSLLFFLVLGALMLGFMPRRLARLRRSIAAAPGQTILLGVVGLSMLIGMVLTVALTIVGLPFVPIIVLAIFVVWTLGYALGAYGVAMRVWTGFGGDDDPSNITRLLVFAAALVVIALLNYIPFVGWIANYTLVLLGIGAMTRAFFHWMLGGPQIAFDVDMKPIED